MTGENARGGSFTRPFRGQLSGCSIIRPRIRTSLNNRRLREQRGAKWPVSILFPLLLSLSLSLSFFYEVQVPLFSKIQLLLLADVFFFFFFLLFLLLLLLLLLLLFLLPLPGGKVHRDRGGLGYTCFAKLGRENLLRGAQFPLLVPPLCPSSPFLSGIELRAQLIKMKAGARIAGVSNRYR